MHNEQGQRAELLSGTAVKVIFAVAVVAVAGVATAQLGVLDLVSGDGGAVDQVPDGVDAVARVDPGVLEDEKANRVYEAAYDQAVGDAREDSDRVRAGASVVPENLTAAGDRIENESGLDLRTIDEIIVFRERSDNFTEPAYAGVIVHAGWNESQVVDVAANNSYAEYENATVDGKTVYRPVESDDGFGTTSEWIGVLGDGEYVFGSEAVVTDTINVTTGDAEALDGDLRSAYDDTRDGYVRYAERPQNVNVTQVEAIDAETELNVTKYAVEYNNLYVTAGSYYATDDGFGVENRILTNETSAAKDVESLIQGSISVQAGAVQNETIESVLRSTEVNRDGTTVTVTRETSVETAIEVIDWFAAISESSDAPVGPMV